MYIIQNVQGMSSGIINRMRKWNLNLYKEMKDTWTGVIEVKLY